MKPANAIILTALLSVLSYKVKAQTTDSTHLSTSARQVHVFPAIMHAPETNWGAGASLVKLFQKGNARSSNITSTAIYTLNNQILLDLSGTVFFDDEKWLARGKSSFRKFPEYYYGIREKSDKANKELVSYQYYNLYGALMRKISRGLFSGIQLNANRYYDVKPDAGLVASGDVYGRNGNRNIGIGALLLWDTRDNIMNASKGSFIEASYLLYNKGLAGQVNYSAISIDVRKYRRVNSKGVVAVQLLSQTKIGTVPFLQLSYLGGSDMMRGFYSGRYRDNNLLAVQAEYRYTITQKWGVVVFGGLGNVTDQWKNFDTSNLKNSIGAGIRRTIDKKDRVNVRLDVGFGNGTSNFYVNIAEAF